MNIPVVAMVRHADWVTLVVLTILGVMSVITWAVIFSRFIHLGSIGGAHAVLKKKFSDLARMGDLEKSDAKLEKTPLGQLGRTAFQEFKRVLTDAQVHTGVKDWSFFLESQFSMAAERLGSQSGQILMAVDKGLIFLAVASSSAPLLGLFGTVWGIMNSFYEIGQQGSASLPVVAPGIAEALITTIVGLTVAIPALFFYNYFMNRVERIEAEMDDARDVLMLRIKREVLALLYASKQKQ